MSASVFTAAAGAAKAMGLSPLGFGTATGIGSAAKSPPSLATYLRGLAHDRRQRGRQDRIKTTGTNKRRPTPGLDRPGSS